MKNNLLVLLGTMLFLSSCNKETLTGSGAIVSEERAVPAFTEVQITGDGEANIVHGATQKVTVTGYQNLLPVYETKLVGSILYLQFKPNEYRIRNNNVKVDIVLPSLSNIQINGSGKMSAKNFTIGNSLFAYINGSGNLNIDNSKYAEVNYKVNGSGNITGHLTETAKGTAEIQGSGYISLKVTDELNAHISGSGIIDYWGSPESVRSDVSGSGKINKR